MALHEQASESGIRITFLRDVRSATTTCLLSICLSLHLYYIGCLFRVPKVLVHKKKTFTLYYCIGIRLHVFPCKLVYEYDIRLQQVFPQHHFTTTRLCNFQLAVQLRSCLYKKSCSLHIRSCKCRDFDRAKRTVLDSLLHTLANWYFSWYCCGPRGGTAVRFTSRA